MRFSLERKGAVLILLIGFTASFAADTQRGTLPVAARPLWLDEAFNGFLAQQGRWAYTETHSRIGSDGKPPDVMAIFRVDPSRPYPEQFIPVKLAGTPPSEKQLKLWAERGEKEAKRRQEQVLAGKSAMDREGDFYLQIYNQKVTPIIEQAVVMAENQNSVTYEVPMRKAGGVDEAIFDTFQLSVRVNKQRHEFEQVTIRQRSPMRVVAGKYSDGLIEIDFASPDPRYPAVPVKISSQSTNKPLFGKARTSHDVAVRTDLRHVTPYAERFGVKIGPVRIIEF